MKQPAKTLTSLQTLEGPVEIDIAVTPEGNFDRRNAAFHFGFSLYGRCFEGHALLGERTSEGTLPVRLTTELGCLPFTAEDAARRERLLQLPAQLRNTGFAIARNTRGRISLSLQLDVPPPATATGIVAAVVTALLEQRERLALVDEACGRVDNLPLR